MQIPTILLSMACLSAGAAGFSQLPTVPSPRCSRDPTALRSEVAATAEADEAAAVRTDPKEAVKLFGRLAEKYISEFRSLRASSSLDQISPVMPNMLFVLLASARCVRGNVLLLCMHR